MLTRDDLIDLIIETVKRHLPAAQAPESQRSNKEKPKAAGRLFLSEYDIKKRLTSGSRRLTIPKDAIVSPLAVDWLVLQGIDIVRK